MAKWLTIDDSVQAAKQHWIGQVLDPLGLDWRIHDGRLEVARGQEVDSAWSVVGELLACHELIRDFADPHAFQPYKPQENHVLLAGALSAARTGHAGDDLIIDLLHEFVWGQGLANGNHRTAIMLVNQRLFPAGHADVSEADLEACSEAFWHASKPMIQGKEFRPDQTAAKGEHLAACRAYVDCLNQASSR